MSAEKFLSFLAAALGFAAFLYLWRRPAVADIPPALLAAIAAAEDARGEALAADTTVEGDQGAFDQAGVKLDGSKQAALEKHRAAGDRAQAALDALKAHFGLA